MKIGLISDTHDNIPMIKKAVEVFNKRNVEIVVHGGDYVAPFSLIPFDELRCQFVGVFGNNDGEKKGLKVRSKGRIHKPPYLLEYKKKRILIFHSLDLNKKVDFSEFDIVVYAHTHEPKAENIKNTLFINPGECGGWLKGRATVAVVDLDIVVDSPAIFEIIDL